MLTTLIAGQLCLIRRGSPTCGDIDHDRLGEKANTIRPRDHDTAFQFHCVIRRV